MNSHHPFPAAQIRHLRLFLTKSETLLRMLELGTRGFYVSAGACHGLFKPQLHRKFVGHLFSAESGKGKPGHDQDVSANNEVFASLQVYSRTSVV